MQMDPADYLKLFVRDGDRIVPAGAEDEEVARRYPIFPDKGPILGGYRITILTRDVTFHAGDLIRIIHVCEAVTTDTRLYVMGPKPVYGEYVDGILSTAALPVGEDFQAPSSYDGRTVNGPAVDFNYEITQYRFNEPGLHLVQWRPGVLISNELKIQVTAHEEQGLGKRHCKLQN
jgi:hypothetical protein